MLPDIGRLRAADGRFRGLRLVHTHLFGEPLSRDDMIDLVRLRLDLVAAVMLTPEGEPRSVHYAYNTPTSDDVLSRSKDAPAPYRQVGPVPMGRLEVNFGELIHALEDEFAKRSRGRAVTAKDGRAILVHVADKSKPLALARAEESL